MLTTRYGESDGVAVNTSDAVSGRQKQGRDFSGGFIFWAGGLCEDPIPGFPYENGGRV